MDGLQPLLLATGIAAAAGTLGAAIARVHAQRAIAREARAMADSIDSGTPAQPSGHALAPLADLAARGVASMQEAQEQAEALRRQMAADMVRLMQQTDGAVRAKDRLLAAIGHDLRQPLQTMDLALEKLRRDSTAEQKHELAQLNAGIRTITDVLDGLLLLSQFDAGTLQAHAGHCELESLFADLAAMQSALAAQAGVELHWHAGKLAVFSDPGMLAGLLGRLVDNAIKASPRGGRVLVAARRSNGYVRIEIRDNGIGIAPVHQPRVFDEFFQVGNPQRDARNGFGLGLSIVSRLAALLGTRVELRSQLHQGSCFWLTLPRATPERMAPRALLLDRDAARRGGLAAMLESWGYAVSADADPVAALARLEGSSGNHDAVLCAVDAADDPAWGLLCRAAQKLPRSTRIVLCANADQAMLAAATHCHAHPVLQPAAPAKLRALLAQRPAVTELRGAA